RGSPQSFGAGDLAALEGCRRSAVRAQKQWAIEIYHLAQLTHQVSGRHGERGAGHVADHHIESQTARLPSDRQPLGEASTFIEFDVDDTEASHQPRQVLQALDALIGADRDRKLETIELRVLPDGKGLL